MATVDTVPMADALDDTIDAALTPARLAARLAAASLPVLTYGVATDVAKAAGLVGEEIASEVLIGAAVALVTSTSKDVTTITLTAGDWIVHGNVVNTPNAATTVTAFSGGISLTANAFDTLPSKGGYARVQQAAVTAGIFALAFTRRIRVAAGQTQVVRLVANSTFAVNTNSVYGYLSANRV